MYYKGCTSSKKHRITKYTHLARVKRQHLITNKSNIVIAIVTKQKAIQSTMMCVCVFNLKVLEGIRQYDHGW